MGLESIPEDYEKFMNTLLGSGQTYRGPENYTMMKGMTADEEAYVDAGQYLDTSQSMPEESLPDKATKEGALNTVKTEPNSLTMEDSCVESRGVEMKRRLSEENGLDGANIPYIVMKEEVKSEAPDFEDVEVSKTILSSW